MTLAEARDEWWKKTITGDGGDCPCCDRWGKMYQRGINRTMAGGMVWLAQMTADGEWIDAPHQGPHWMVRSNQYQTMRWWGLCERCAPLPGEDKKFSGFWRITDLGKQWTNNKVKVPKYVWTYDNTVIKFEGPMVGIDEIFEDFSYNAVMKTKFE
jgi:hypothetical protein